MLTYQDYHTNSINKSIHAVCIPLIVITTINILSTIKVKFTSSKYFLEMTLAEVLTYYMSVMYYFNYGLYIYAYMCIYLFIANNISWMWGLHPKFFNQSLLVFTISWIAQFIGHYIEGNRPALFTSISQAFLEAPLFSLNYIVPIM